VNRISDIELLVP